MINTKNIFTSLAIFKISYIVILTTLLLALYNKNAFMEFTYSWGMLIFIISASVMASYMFNTILNIKNISIESNINISSYFILSGASFLLVSLYKFSNGTFNFQKIEGEFLLINIGYLIYGLLIAYKTKLYNEDKETLWKNSSFSVPIFTLFSQLYIGNINYCNSVILENVIVNAIKQILLAGRSI